jgi:hypothetical protein
MVASQQTKIRGDLMFFYFFSRQEKTLTVGQNLLEALANSIWSIKDHASSYP